MGNKYPSEALPELNYLYQLDGRGIKLDLDRVRRALTLLGSPSDNYKIIHVAGTNGKGSTCAMLASALENAGFKVGLYTSPHLLSFNERIRVNGEKIPDNFICSFISEYRKVLDDYNLTFFEATTLMALIYFAHKGVEWVILETGMGGRLDATNIVRPMVNVITPIGKDHQEYLGSTLRKIAFEKAGIAKSGVRCIISRQSRYLKKILFSYVSEIEAIPIYAPSLCKVWLKDASIARQIVKFELPLAVEGQITLPLAGEHQLVNLQTALVTLWQLREFLPSLEKAIAGIEKTRWSGRLQILQEKPMVIFDVSHNLHGIATTLKSLSNLLENRKFKVLLALGKSKRFRGIGNYFADIVEKVYITELAGYPSVSAKELYEELARYIGETKLSINADLYSLLVQVIDELQEDEILLIMGSHYLAPVVFPFFKINV